MSEKASIFQAPTTDDEGWPIIMRTNALYQGAYAVMLLLTLAGAIICGILKVTTGTVIFAVLAVISGLVAINGLNDCVLVFKDRILRKGLLGKGTEMGVKEITSMSIRKAGGADVYVLRVQDYKSIQVNTALLDNSARFVEWVERNQPRNKWKVE